MRSTVVVLLKKTSNGANGFGMSDIENLIEVNLTVNCVYDSFMNKGRQTQIHKIKEISSASITAADPKSLARFDRSWCSKEMRSIAASTLELSSSIAMTSTREEINTAFSNSDTGNATAIGVISTNRVSSCRNALSSLNANTSPCHEFLAACHARTNPRLRLCGFWSMWYVFFNGLRLLLTPGRYGAL